MFVWKINSVPSTRDKSDYDLLSNVFRGALFSIKSNTTSSPCIELLFLRNHSISIRLYVILRNEIAQKTAEQIESQLTGAGFNLELLPNEDEKSLLNEMRALLSEETCCVIKTEKVVTTPFLQEGYYYWADPILSNREESAPEQLGALFHGLFQCDEAAVSFQLFPACFEPYENDALQYLTTFLSSHVRMGSPSYEGTYEPYAKLAYDSYRYYASSNQPLFQYNISISATHGNARHIAAQVVSSIQSVTKNNPDLQIVNVPLRFDHSFDYDSLPYHVLSYVQQQCRDTFIWGGQIQPPNLLFRFPFLVSVDEALVFFRLPYDDGHLRGIVGSPYRDANEVIGGDVLNTNGMQIGRLLGNRKELLCAEVEDFSRHCLIVGMPGTGKTTFSINLLLQFKKKGVPFLAIEPTKSEYRAMIDAIPELQIFTPGNNSISPFILNPFIPPKGVRTEKYIPSLFSAFKAAISMPSPLDAVFMKTIRACYIKYGWRDYSCAGDPEVSPFGFYEFIQEFKRIVDEEKYSPEVKGNLRSGGVLRLANLIEQNRNIFDTVQTIPIDDLLSKPTVIELNAIDDNELKALIISLILINTSVYTKSMQEDVSGLRNVILVDEAHVLLGQRTLQKEDQAGGANFAVQLVENMIAELRSYRTSIIIADQRPTAVGSSIVANTDIKISFRLTERKEKELIGYSSDMDDSAIQQLSQLDRGQAFVYYHKVKKPHIVETPDIRLKEGIRIYVSDEEVCERNHYWKSHSDLLIPHTMCYYCSGCKNGCDFKVRADAEYYANFIWSKVGHEIVDAKALMQRACGVPILLKNTIENYGTEKQSKLIACIRIALIRKAGFERQFSLTKKQEESVLNYELEME